MLGRVGVGPRHKNAVVRFVGKARPDFLAVHNKVVAIVNRPRLEGGQVRAGARSE